MTKEEYEKLSPNMQVAFEHLTSEWTEKVDENGSKHFSIDIRPSNHAWEDFCNKNVKFIDSIEDKDLIRSIRLVFDSGFNGGFVFAKNYFVG